MQTQPSSASSCVDSPLQYLLCVDSSCVSSSADPPSCVSSSADPSFVPGWWTQAPVRQLLSYALSVRWSARTEECGPFFKPSLHISSQHPLTKMRQLKGKPKKETSKDKKERKQAMQEARQQITTVVLPTLAVVVLLIVVFVYVATRPTVTE